jgi:tRNA pseudouridine55 synthase
LNGLFAVVKPPGIVSHDIVDLMRRLVAYWIRDAKLRTADKKIHQDLGHSKPAIANDLIPINDDRHPMRIAEEEAMEFAASGNGGKPPKRRRLPKWPSEAKVGHGGTLDPLASGVLVLAIGNGTKMLQYFLKGSEKVYVGHGTFGSATDTFDNTGKTTKTASVSHITKDMVVKMLNEKFTGEIEQVPPVYSALKVKGQRMCDIVRNNEKSGNVDKPVPVVKSRMATINSIDLIDFKKLDDTIDFSLKISCGSGTYIRSIIHDLGGALDCAAHMTDLQRTRQGMFTSDVVESKDVKYIPAISVEDLLDFDKFCAHLDNQKYQTIIKDGIASPPTPNTDDACPVVEPLAKQEKKQKII